MANIKISELHPVGIELFQDEETFLDQLAEHEKSLVSGERDYPIIVANLALFCHSKRSTLRLCLCQEIF